MKILFITNYYPPFEVGGYEQLCRDVAVYLAKRGHAVRVLTSNRGVTNHSELNEPDVHRTLWIHPNFKSKISPALQFFLMRHRAEEHNRRCLRCVVEHHTPDVILIWNLEDLPRSIACEAESIVDTSTAYWLAGRSPAESDEYWSYWTKSALSLMVRPFKSLLAGPALHIMRQEGKPVHPEMRHVAAVSHYVRRKGIAAGTLPDHTRVIYNGVEVESFLRQVPTDVDGTLKLLQAGRISPDKGVHTAVEAIGKLIGLNPMPDVHLDIIGSGPMEYQASLKRIVRQHGIGDKVSFSGWVPREDMPAVMSRYHVLLLPTVHPEPFARIVLEAMTAGLAVIGTLTGGSGELLEDGITALTFAPGSSTDLAAQIHRLASEHGLRYRLATSGQQMVVDHFSLGHMVDNIERLLEDALRNEHRTPVQPVMQQGHSIAQGVSRLAPMK